MIHSESEKSIQYAKELLQTHLDTPGKERINLHSRDPQTLEALFPGTKGENAPKMLELIKMAVEGFVENRKNFYPGDPGYINDQIQNSEGFKKTMNHLENEYKLLIDQLKGSGTFFSMRSIGHMLWDTALPGTLGYFAALLYNQNNVAAEASPVTTIMEMYVGNELCKMLGYQVKPIGSIKPMVMFVKPPPVIPSGWGHITCDGSIANLEALWMARNLKLYAVSARAALEHLEELKVAEKVKVTLLNGEEAVLKDLDDWTILNLPIDEVLRIPEKILQMDTEKLTETIVAKAINEYSVQNLGYLQIIKEFLPNIKKGPVSFCSSTRHYSWPKGAAILGIGAKNMISVFVDEKARMEIKELKIHLDKCLREKIPVINVVAIIGSTEESAVDPIKEIFELRESYRKLGLEFAIHADAAWGGYFRSMLIDSHGATSPDTHFEVLDETQRAQLPMSDYVSKQYLALGNSDSITIDPHKSGYIPYPAGGLCYRNSAMRNLVAFTAPVVYHGGVDPTVGVYGVEGSKPGAAAAAVYFSHRTISPNKDGYGELSGRCFFNAKRLYAALVCLNLDETLPFCVTPLIPIPAIQEGKNKQEVMEEYKFIRDRIVNKTNKELIQDSEAFSLFRKLGGDQTIITYIYNFRKGHSNFEGDLDKINELNTAVYEKFSFRRNTEGKEYKPEIIVTSSSFTREDYGQKFMANLLNRLGVHISEEHPGSKESTIFKRPINFIISTIMNPWLSDTVDGSFIPVLIKDITANLKTIVEKLNSEKETIEL